MDYNLKDRDGVETTYTKDKIKIPAATGDGMVVFTQGEAQAEKTVDIAENGAFTVEPDAGYDFVKKVSGMVAVPATQPVLQEKSVNITSNGQTSVTPDSGKDGLSKVDITVAVPTPAPKLQKKSVSITANGTGSVLPDAGNDGLSEVDYTVDVPSPTLVAKTVKLDFPRSDVNSSYYENMEVLPEEGQAFNSLTIKIPSTLLGENVKEGVNIAGVTGAYRDETPKALNHEGINFISWDGTVVETWTLEELATKTALPKVPETLPALTIPARNGAQGVQMSIDFLTTGLLKEVPSMCLSWNSTIDELKESNSPANVGLCYQCDKVLDVKVEGLGTFTTYPIRIAPHIVVLELPHAMDINLGRQRFWDNGLGKGGTFDKVSFPYGGQFVLQLRLMTDTQLTSNMITAEMRPYVKSIIFPQADRDKMAGGSGLTSGYNKTCIGLMANPYRNCPNIKTVAISRSGGTVSREDDSFGDFLGCYSLETISLPVKPSTLGGYGWNIRSMLAREKQAESPYGAMSYNLKNIIIPKLTSGNVYSWQNCFGSIEAIVFGFNANTGNEEGILHQEYISADDQNIVPWPNLKLIDLSRTAFLDFYELFGSASTSYMKLKLPAGKSITIKVPASQLDTYKAADGWKDFADYIVGV